MEAVRRRVALFIFLFLVGEVSALPALIGSARAEIKFRYTRAECVQCHAARVNEITTAGGKHRSVPCVGCHAGHPPDVAKPIARCSKCHSPARKTHFETPGCLNCHTNPHTPLKITFKGGEACLNCHGTQTEQLRENPSKHTLLGCTTCHDVHRKIPQCIQCHVPHGGKVTGGCNKCHNPHMPKLVTYPSDIPSKDCGSCHKKPADLLAATTSRHKPLECARCHQGKHRVIPACQDCHGSPHPAGIMVKFPKCGKCHNTAHDLNNWTQAVSRETTTAAVSRETTTAAVSGKTTTEAQEPPKKQ